MLKKLKEKIKNARIKKEEKKNEKILNKPVFEINTLYVGEIVLYKKCEKVGLGNYDHYYREVKKFAFFYKTELGKYRHIVSQQVLSELGDYDAIVGDYAVHKIRTFQEAFPIYMRKNNLTPSSKVSLNFIYENEAELNEELAPNQQVVDLFK